MRHTRLCWSSVAASKEFFFGSADEIGVVGVTAAEGWEGRPCERERVWVGCGGRVAGWDMRTGNCTHEPTPGHPMASRRAYERRPVTSNKRARLQD